MGDKLKMTRAFKTHLAIYSTIVILIPLIIIIYKNKESLEGWWTEIKAFFAGLPDIVKTIYTFINEKILYNIVYYLARPASKSSIGLSTISIVLIIFFISFIVSYVRLFIGQSKLRSKVMPHWTYKFLKKHRRTGDSIFIVLLIYLVMLLYKKYAVGILGGKDVLSRLPRLIGIGAGIIAFVIFYYYINKNYKKSSFTLHYKRYETTTANASGEDTKHLVWASKQIRYMSIFNMALIILPIVYFASKQGSKIVGATDFGFKMWYLPLMASPVILFYGYPYIKDWVQKTVTSITKKTVLLDEPVYIEDISKNYGLPYNLGDYKSINQKYSNYEIGDVTTPAVPTYTISLWMWMDDVTSANKDDFETVLNFNNKPNILVNQSSREIKILFDDTSNENDKPRTIYLDNLKSQKWNNIVVIFANNIVEVYINTKIVAEQKNIIPDMNDIYFDNLVVGNADSSLKIALQKIEYYPRAITSNEIKHFYNIKSIMN